MTTKSENTRRLSAEMREDPENYMVSVADALHDLDLADTELATLRAQLAETQAALEALRVAQLSHPGRDLIGIITELLEEDQYPENEDIFERDVFKPIGALCADLATAQETIQQQAGQIARLEQEFSDADFYGKAALKDALEGDDIIAERDGQIAALREALHGLWQIVNLGDCPLSDRVVTALDNSAASAAQFVERIRAEERERTLEEVVGVISKHRGSLWIGLVPDDHDYDNPTPDLCNTIRNLKLQPATAEPGKEAGNG